jgi:hypothetical protein
LGKKDRHPPISHQQGLRWAKAIHQIDHQRSPARSRLSAEAARAALVSSWQASQMKPDIIDALIIGFIGAALFLFVDKYEREGPVARLLKFW